MQHCHQLRLLHLLVQFDRRPALGQMPQLSDFAPALLQCRCIGRLAFVVFVALGLVACVPQPPVYRYDDPGMRAALARIPHVRIDFVRQHDAVSCGLAVTESVARAWGVRANQAVLYRKYPPKNAKKGYSLGELRAIAEHLGMKAYILRADADFLVRTIAKGRPVIVAIKARPRPRIRPIGAAGLMVMRLFVREYDHFVVVIGLDTAQVAVMDPVQGFYLIAHADFLAMWRKMHHAALLIAL